MRVGLPESPDLDHDHHNHTNVDNNYDHLKLQHGLPLTVSGNGRYLVDQDDVPLLMIGDSPHALTVSISEVVDLGPTDQRREATFTPTCGPGCHDAGTEAVPMTRQPSGQRLVASISR